jgi:hypothetical protein
VASLDSTSGYLLLNRTFVLHQICRLDSHSHTSIQPMTGGRRKLHYVPVTRARRLSKFHYVLTRWFVSLSDLLLFGRMATVSFAQQPA